MNKAIILSIGDELVLGQTVDTNSAWISQQLASVGCDIAAHLTVSDDQSAVEQAMLESVGRCDFLIISGGIGPTEDDLTRQALAVVMNEPLELNDTWLKRLEGFFAARGRPMPAINRIQAMIPRGARMIDNSAGTAAGIDATYQSGDLKNNCRIFVMPGVPKEMKIMFAREVLPHIRAAGAGACIVSRTLHTYGLGESTIAEKLGDLMRRGRNPSVGTTVSEGQVSIRVNSRSPSEPQACEQLEQTVAACRAALGTLIFGQDDQTLAQVVSDHLSNLPGPPQLAVAESATGGLLAAMLTDPPASTFFSRGWVVYSPQSKTDLLGIPREFIEKHGIVSEPVALAMAASAREGAKADLALSITGIAGPDGGTPETPVGTTCIGLSYAQGSRARTFKFPGDREMVRDRAAKMALTLLRFHLLGESPPF